AWPRRHRLEAQGLCLPFRALTRLAQNEELKCPSRETGRRGGLVKGVPEMSVALAASHQLLSRAVPGLCKPHSLPPSPIQERQQGSGDPDEIRKTECMSSEHFGQFAWQFKRMSGSSGLKVQAAIAC